MSYVGPTTGVSYVGPTTGVSGDARVYGHAQVSGDARVYGHAQVYGHAWVFGNACVSGDARVSGDAQVYGHAWVYGDACVSGDARVYGHAWVYGDACVRKQTDIAWVDRVGAGNPMTLHRTETDGVEGWRINAGCRHWEAATVAEVCEMVRNNVAGGPVEWKERCVDVQTISRWGRQVRMALAYLASMVEEGK